MAQATPTGRAARRKAMARLDADRKRRKAEAAAQAGAAASICQKQPGRLQKQDLDPDEKLMHGKVPQLEDWVDVWAAISTHMQVP